MKIRLSCLFPIVCCGAALGQTAAQPAAVPVPLEGTPAVLPPQRLGPGDLVNVNVYEAPEMSKPVRVASDGTVRLPLLKSSVKATNIMPDELAASISDELKLENLMVNPLVSVTVNEYLSRPVTVTGAVSHPTTFQAFGETTLMTAIAKADGITSFAGPDVLVSIPQTDADGKQTRKLKKVPLQALMNGADPTLNIELHGGEQVSVPEALKVYVLGNVKKPGAYLVQDANDSSVLKVLALSEGLTPFSTKEAYIYRQASGQGQRQEIPVALSSIVQRKSPDVTLQGGDIFYVPDNHGKRITVNALERIAGFGTSTASGVLIWH